MKVRVALSGQEGWWVQGGETDSKADGSILFNGIEPAAFAIQVNKLPPGTYLKSILWGDRPLADNQLDLSQGTQGKTLEVLLSPHAAELSGVVREADPAGAGAFVRLRDSHGGIQFTEIDQNGAFRFENLAPGWYTVFAGEGPIPEKPAPESRRQAELKLEEDGRATVALVASLPNPALAASPESPRPLPSPHP